MDTFSDIMEHPHHVSKKRKQMPIANRAAQFSAFAALTGYEEKIDTASRISGEEIAQRVLNEIILMQNISRHP